MYYSTEEGAPGSWRVGARAPGAVWKAGPGRPHDTFNFGYNMMALLPTAAAAGPGPAATVAAQL